MRKIARYLTHPTRRAKTSRSTGETTARQRNKAQVEGKTEWNLLIRSISALSSMTLTDFFHILLGRPLEGRLVIQHAVQSLELLRFLLLISDGGIATPDAFVSTEFDDRQGIKVLPRRHGG